MPHPVIDAATMFRRGLLNRERQQAMALVNAYGRIYGRMGDSIRALEEQIAGMEEPTAWKSNRLSALRALQTQVADEVGKFAVYADTTIVNAATAEIPIAGANSRALAQAYFNSPQARQALAARWDVLPAEAIETMLGFVGNESPLNTALVQRLGPTVADRMFSNMVDAIALGINPRTVAAQIRRELGTGLTWTLTTQRTAQLWAYREATRASYLANSDIVSSWTWYATLNDSRTCMSCIAKHGTVYPLTETLNDHHNGRCVAIPNVKMASKLGISLPDVPSGESWFRSLPEGTQAKYMGPAMHAAFKADEFEFADLSQNYTDPIYGDMARQASLKDLLGNRAKEYYTR
jgi:hypothetical protein